MEEDSCFRIGEPTLQEYKEYFARFPPIEIPSNLSLKPKLEATSLNKTLDHLSNSVDLEHLSDSDDELSLSFKDFLEEASKKRKSSTSEPMVEPESPPQSRCVNINDILELDEKTDHHEIVDNTAESFCFPSMSEEPDESVVSHDKPSIYIGTPTFKEKLNFLKRKMCPPKANETMFSSEVDSSFEDFLRVKRQKLIKRKEVKNQELLERDPDL